MFDGDSSGFIIHPTDRAICAQEEQAMADGRSGQEQANARHDGSRRAEVEVASNHHDLTLPTVNGV